MTSLIQSGMPAGAEVSYNGFNFNPTLRMRINAEVVKTPDNRGYLYTRYTVQVQAYIFATTESGEATNMAEVRQKLLEPGKNLKITGLGNHFEVMPSNDVDWGPKPLSCDMNPAGGGLIWEITWSCEFNRNDCQVGSAAIMTRTFSVSYSVQDGMTTRTINGMFRVAGVRTGNPTVDLHTAMSGQSIPVPLGFRRRSFQRSYSDDKTALTFTVVDEEMDPHALPDGVTDSDLEYGISNTTPNGFISWQASLQGSITVAPGVPKSYAALKFITILFQRVLVLRSLTSNKKAFPFPERISIRHRMHTRTTYFSVSFSIFGCLDEIMSKSGMWDPIEGTSHAQWLASMESLGMHRASGPAGLLPNPAEGVIIDTCNPGTPPIGQDVLDGSYSDQPFDEIFSCDGVTEENSWMYWENKVYFIRNRSVEWHSILETFGHTVSQIAQGIAGAPFSGSSEPIGQEMGPPEVFAVMIGRGVRLKFAPFAPTLQSVGGVGVEELDCYGDGPARVLATIFGCPILAKKWIRVYRIKGYPDETAARQALIPDDPVRRDCVHAYGDTNSN